MSEMLIWGLSLAVGLGTFALRLSFIELHGRLRVPTLLSQALVYVPPAVLAALVLPAVVYPPGHTSMSLTDPQIPAAIVAALLAWRTRNAVLPLAAGMATLWLLKYYGL